MATVLVFGATGWIGGSVCRLVEERGGFTVVRATSRLEDSVAVCAELASVRPDFVVHAAGLVSFIV